MIWIVVELAIIQELSFLHPIFFGVGLVIAASACPLGVADLPGLASRPIGGTGGDQDASGQFGIATAMLLALFILAPVGLAADPPRAGDRVLISINGDVDLPAGRHADAVVVINGTATIEGDVGTLVAINGAAVMTGATAETVVAVGSPITLASGTVVTGDVRTLDSTVEQLDTAVVQGNVRDVSLELVAFGAILAPALILFALGFSARGARGRPRAGRRGLPPGPEGRVADQPRARADAGPD